MTSLPPGRAVASFLIVGLAAVTAALVAGCRDGPEKAPEVEGGILPDLTMSPPEDLRIEVTDDGRHELRFDSIMNNLGSGDFVVTAERGPEGWTLAQRIALEGGGVEVVLLSADLAFGGDSHDHWHVANAARYRLQGIGADLDGNRFSQKVGFCMFDSVHQEPDRPGAPDDVTHLIDGCGTSDSTELEMGISIGWGDRYRSTLEGQFIDVTGVPEGLYRLMLHVDPDGIFREEDTRNNRAWVDFQLGPPAEPGGALSLVELASGNTYTRE